MRIKFNINSLFSSLLFCSRNLLITIVIRVSLRRTYILFASLIVLRSWSLRKTKMSYFLFFHTLIFRLRNDWTLFALFNFQGTLSHISATFFIIHHYVLFVNTFFKLFWSFLFVILCCNYLRNNALYDTSSRLFCQYVFSIFLSFLSHIVEPSVTMFYILN